MNIETTWYVGMTLEEMEKQIILKSLHFFHGNKTKTAESLGIAIRTIDNKLEKYEEQENARIKRDEEREQRAAIALSQAQRGFQVEPVIKATEEPALPMRQRIEIQEMPLKQVAGNHSNKSRKSY